MDPESITIATGQPSDKNEILDFLVKYFLADEPMNQVVISINVGIETLLQE